MVIAATFPLDILKWDGSHGVRGPFPLLFSEQPGEPGTVLELAPMRFIGPMKQIASRYIHSTNIRPPTLSEPRPHQSHSDSNRRGIPDTNRHG